MKQYFYICVLALVMMSVTGCDFFRKVAGRPTSDVIEAKRAEIMLRKEQDRRDSIAYADSVAAVRRMQKDSAEAYAFLTNAGVMTFTPVRLGGVSGSALQNRYYVVVGSFRHPSNAEYMLKNMSEVDGCRPELIRFRNGMIAVAAFPSDRLQDVVDGYRRVKTHPACPADAWILKNE